MRSKVMSVTIAMAVSVAFAIGAAAKSAIINVSSQSVSANRGASGNYCLVRFDPPSELAGKRVDSVLLDFVVDVTTTNEDGGSLLLTPLIGVYPLTAEPGAGAPEYESGLPTMTPVPVGEAQRVTTDVTEIVRGWIADPSSNHGLIITSVAGHAISVSGDGVAFGRGRCSR